MCMKAYAMLLVTYRVFLACKGSFDLLCLVEVVAKTLTQLTGLR